MSKQIICKCLDLIGEDPGWYRCFQLGASGSDEDVDKITKVISGLLGDGCEPKVKQTITVCMKLIKESDYWYDCFEDALSGSDEDIEKLVNVVLESTDNE